MVSVFGKVAIGLAAIGAAGVGAVGREGEIFRRVIGHSLLLTALMGLLAMLQAYVLRWMIPS